MKNAVAKFGLLAVMVIIAASASAQAQSLSYRLTANIPFEFSVAGKKLPAGKYWVNRAQQSSGDTVVQISSTDGHSNVIRFTKLDGQFFNCLVNQLRPDFQNVRGFRIKIVRLFRQHHFVEVA